MAQTKYKLNDRVIKFYPKKRQHKNRTNFMCFMVIGVAENYRYITDCNQIKIEPLYKCKRIKVNGELSSRYNQILYLTETEIDMKLNKHHKNKNSSKTKAPAISKNELKNMYYKKDMTFEEIGKAIGYTGSYVSVLAKKYNIKTKWDLSTKELEKIIKNI